MLILKSWSFVSLALKVITLAFSLAWLLCLRVICEHLSIQWETTIALGALSSLRLHEHESYPKKTNEEQALLVTTEQFLYSPITITKIRLLKREDDNKRSYRF
jgi:hypothetical protein